QAQVAWTLGAVDPDEGLGESGKVHLDPEVVALGVRASGGDDVLAQSAAHLDHELGAAAEELLEIDPRALAGQGVALAARRVQDVVVREPVPGGLAGGGEPLAAAHEGDDVAVGAPGLLAAAGRGLRL